MATLTSKAKQSFSLQLGSPEAMQAWGRRLARLLKPGDVVALVGTLGSGKTTLVQGIAKGWGYTRRANSPTFALVNEYQSPRGPLLHMDMYRLTPDELDAFPLEDYLEAKTVCLIEWADRITERLPADSLEIRLKTLSPTERQLDVLPSKSWQKRLKAAAR